MTNNQVHLKEKHRRLFVGLSEEWVVVLYKSLTKRKEFRPSRCVKSGKLKCYSGFEQREPTAVLKLIRNHPHPDGWLSHACYPPPRGAGELCPPMTTRIPESSSFTFHFSMIVMDLSWKRERCRLAHSPRSLPVWLTLGLNHQQEAHGYLTGVIKNGELNGAFKVLLPNRPQALVQPGLSIVDWEDHRLGFKRNGLTHTSVTTELPFLCFNCPSSHALIPPQGPIYRTTQSQASGQRARCLGLLSKLLVFFRSIRFTMSYISLNWSFRCFWKGNKNPRGIINFPNSMANSCVFLSPVRNTTFWLKQASVYLPIH